MAVGTLSQQRNITGRRIPGPEYVSKERRARNRPLLKLSRDRMASAVDAYDRVLAMSTEIRKRHGLEPVPDTETMSQARAIVASSPKRPAKASRQVSASRLATLTPVEKARALRKRREELETERLAVDAEIRDLVAVAQNDGDISISWIAETLGLSRQRIYQLAG